MKTCMTCPALMPNISNDDECGTCIGRRQRRAYRDSANVHALVDAIIREALWFGRSHRLAGTHNTKHILSETLDPVGAFAS